MTTLNDWVAENTFKDLAFPFENLSISFHSEHASKMPTCKLFMSKLQNNTFESGTKHKVKSTYVEMISIVYFKKMC